MRNRLTIVLSMAIAGLGAVLPAAAQMRTPGVLLKVAVPVVIAGHTLQPGSYELGSSSTPNVVMIQKTGDARTSMFLLPTVVSDGDHYRGVPPSLVQATNTASGVPTITSIYFPAQDRAYYFSPKLEDAAQVTAHRQTAAASTTAR